MRILLVEDDRKLNDVLVFRLKQEGLTVDSCFDGEEALYYAKQKIHDCILLDRMLPRLDGIQVLHELRQSGNVVPIILITALGALQDKIDGLDCGADDYLVKPFEFKELMARIRSVTRRNGNVITLNALSFGDVSYDPDSSVLTGPSASCTLSRREGNLLEAFLRNSGQTLSREILLTKVWGLDSDVENGNLDNYIHFLRRRLKTAGSLIQLKNVWGVGYRLELSV